MTETLGLEPIERRADELELHKVDSGEYPDVQFAPGVLDHDYWKINDRGTTTTYINVENRILEATNHLSSTTYKIIAGVGSIGIRRSGVVATFNLETTSEPVKVRIPRAERYWYDGTFSALVERPVPPYAAFITLGDEKLSREAKQELKRLEREYRRRQIMDSIVDSFASKMETILALSTHFAQIDQTRQRTEELVATGDRL